MERDEPATRNVHGDRDRSDVSVHSQRRELATSPPQHFADCRPKSNSSSCLPGSGDWDERAPLFSLSVGGGREACCDATAAPRPEPYPVASRPQRSCRVVRAGVSGDEMPSAAARLGARRPIWSNCCGKHKSRERDHGSGHDEGHAPSHETGEHSFPVAFV